MRFRLIPAVVALAGLSGCSGVQSALDTHGPHADAIAGLIWIFTAVAALVWIAVMVALGIAVLRRRRGFDPDPLAPRRDRPAGPIVTSAAILTAVVIVALTVLSYLTDRSLASIGGQD